MEQEIPQNLEQLSHEERLKIANDFKNKGNECYLSIPDFDF